MASTPPLLLRILATSANAATRAGKIIRDIKEKGNLGVIEKVYNTSRVLYNPIT